MARRLSAKSLVPVTALFIGMLGPCAWATPYWTPEQIAEDYARSGAAFQPRFVPPRDWHERFTLDEILYFEHYRMLCDFLVSLQYSSAGANLGGMIEGESGSDHNIIQTDNTQEAIRVWSQYAIWTGDTATYSPNIRLAKGYCNRYPAWREGAGYYSIHNCGWGFEAERKYRQAYGDTSWTWYADSCAVWVVSQPLSFDPNSTGLGQLDPCAEGLGVGGLYPHAVYRGRTDWQNFAITQARLLRTWFQSNPARLNANETWALCGGTALWGVCVSLFALYPDSGQLWLTQYGPQLDIWQSTGTWNHSFNCWYANAQFEVFALTHDTTYWNNGVFIADSLIGLDHDDDGGIPPGSTFPQTNDHSWVSAYMGWMGMERIINTSPLRDVAAAGFTSPSLLPHLAGDTLRVTARVMNLGWVPLNVQATVLGPYCRDTLNVLLPQQTDSILAFPQPWVLPDNDSLPTVVPLTLQTRAPQDEDSANDTVTVCFDIRRGCDVIGFVYGDSPPNTVPARIEFYHEAYPDSPWVLTQSEAGQFYSNVPRRLMAGRNTIRVIPPLKYMIQEQAVELVPGPAPSRVDFQLQRTAIALLDDDAGDTLERWLQTSLDSIPLASRWWDKAAWGDAELADIPIVLWFTGNDSLTTLEESEQTLLQNYLSGGGHLLLSGQNITDNLGYDSPFLTQVLHCQAGDPDNGQRIVQGMSGNSITDGMTLYLIGSSGAWNQNSPSGVSPLDGSTAILRYSSGGGDTCGVSGFYGEGRYIFLSFGIEAVSGIQGSTTRHELLSRCFTWLDTLESARSSPTAVLSFELSQNFPNPFNPGTWIRFVVPRGIAPVNLTVFNLLGQEVCRLYDGPGTGASQTVYWNGTTTRGNPVASGLYVYRLQAGSMSAAKTLHLLR
jgi:hypothetical protein